MKAEYLLKVIIPPFIIFAVLVWLTINNYISGWLMYLLWVVGFVAANLIVTRVTAKRSYHRLKQKREKEAQQDNNDSQK